MAQRHVGGCLEERNDFCKKSTKTEPFKKILLFFCRVGMFQQKYFVQTVIFKAELLPAILERNSQDGRTTVLLCTITVAFLALQATDPLLVYYHLFVYLQLGKAIQESFPSD